MKAHTGPSGKLLVYDKPQKIPQYMDDNIPYMFDNWADCYGFSSPTKMPHGQAISAVTWRHIPEL